MHVGSPLIQLQSSLRIASFIASISSSRSASSFFIQCISPFEPILYSYLDQSYGCTPVAWIPRSILVAEDGDDRYNGHPMNLAASFIDGLVAE